MQPRKLFIDVTGREFVNTLNVDGSVTLSDYLAFNEDVEAMELYFVEQTGDPTAPYRYLDYSANTVKLAIGVTAPAAVVTAWTAAPTAVTVSTSVTVTGGAGTKAIQRVQISPEPLTGSYVLKVPSRSATVVSVASAIFNAPFHGLRDGQSVTLTGFSTPTGFTNGSVVFVRDSWRDAFRIASSASGTAITASASSGGTAITDDFTTRPIPANTPTSVVATLLASATNDPAQNIRVSGTANDYLLTFDGFYEGVEMPLVTSPLSTLLGPPKQTGNLSLNTVEVAALIAAGATNVTLEVEISDGTVRQTFQRAATLADDIIKSTSPTPLPANTSFLLQSADESVWQISVDDDGILTATKQ
jgi:hypothetical protein